MNYAPIALFVYNRVEYLHKTIDSLKKCSNVEKHEVFIFSDAPKKYKHGDEEKVNRVREYIKTIEAENIFEKVNLIEATEHKGCANSIIDGINYVFTFYDRVIDLEDDLLFSEDALDYINDGLNYYESDKRVWSISSYTPPVKALETYNRTTFMGERASSCGFGIWKDRWDKVDWQMGWFEELRDDKERIYSFGEWGYDLPFMLMEQAERFIDAWDIIACYTQFINKMYSVFPRNSKCFTIGVTGTHYDGEELVQQKMDLRPKRYSFDECEYDERISEERKSIFMTREQFVNSNFYSEEMKYKRYFSLLVRWMSNREQNIGVEDYLLERHIGSVVIYGAGKIGNLVFDELNKSGKVLVKGFVDKNLKSIDSKIIVSPQEIKEFGDVEAIIVTPIMDFFRIKKELSGYKECRILSLWEIVNH